MATTCAFCGNPTKTHDALGLCPPQSESAAPIGTMRQIQMTLDVLLRLSEERTDGRLRDAIALVRSELHEELEQ